MTEEPIVCRQTGTSHSCVRIAIGETHTTFLPMETMQLEKLTNREFALNWKPYEVYPVGRAAKVYLGAAQYREIEPQVRKILERILSNPATPIDLDPSVFPSSTSHQKETVMSEAKSATPETTAAKKTVKNAAAPAKKAAKSAPAAAAKKVPGKQAAAAKQPAAKKAAKSAPGKQAVAAVAKTLAKGNKQAAAAKKPLGRPASNEKLRVLDPEAPRRGATADFVAAAIKLKTFTRQELTDAMIKAGYEEKAARIKVADMVYFEVIGAAK